MSVALTLGVLLATVGTIAQADTLRFALHKAPAKQNLLVQHDFVGEKVSNFHDVIYRGVVTVGTPPQSQLVLFHTGCTLTRFPKKGCVASGRFSDACTGKTYDPAASSTARLQRYSNFEVTEIEYTHFGAKGEMYHDTLGIGDPANGKQLVLKDASIGASSKVWQFDHAVVCLGFPSSSMTNSTFSELVNARVLDKPLLTVAFKKCDQECVEGGSITFGEFDKENCAADVHWVPVVEGSFMWRFKLDSFSINGHAQQVNGALANTDTGNSYLHVPRDMMPFLMKELKADKRRGYLTAPCDSKFELTFGINGKLFRVTEKEILLNQGFEGRCVLAITENRYKQRMFILGDAFSRGFCQIHDLGQKRMGFAATKQH